MGILEEFSERNVLVFLVALVLFYLFYKIRRIQFDETHIYRIYGKSEKTLPFSNIESIKRTGISLNGTRLWKVTYLDKDDIERKFLFKEGTFQHGSTKELISAVRKVKPSVLIWENPYFNHPKEKKK